MKSTLFARIPAIILVLILNVQLSSTAVGQACVEQVMRDFQIRYKMLNGGYLRWPACSTGQTPAPMFPKNGFYGDLTLDPDRGAEIVNDLLQKFHSTAVIYPYFVKANGYSELEGVSTIPTYTSADMLSPVSVDAGNYMDALQQLAANLGKLQLIKVNASQLVASDGSDTKETMAGTGQRDPPLVDLAYIQNCAVSADPMTPWGRRTYYNWENCQGIVSQNPIPSGLSIARVFESGGAYAESPDDGGWFVFLSAIQHTRGRISADLMAYKPGTAKVFLKLTEPSCAFADWWRAYELTCSSTFAQTRPTSAPQDTYGAWINVLPGGVVTTEYVTYSDVTPSAMGAYNDGHYNIYGWSVADAVVIVAPDFTTTADPQDCCSCTECEAGSTSFALQSIHINFGLGSDNFMGQAGSLTLDADRPSTELSTLAALRYSVANTVEVIKSPTEPLTHMQFRTSQSLAEVQSINDYKYAISVYALADSGSKEANGFYQPIGSAFTTIVVENPDASPTVYNRLRITTTTDSNTSVTDYSYTPATGQWEMDMGSGLRKETRVSTWDGTRTLRTETVTVMGSLNNVVYKEINKYQLFPWGQERISNTVDPDNAALTSCWTFYSNASTDGGNYRQLKEYVDANGHWTQYQYDVDGREISRTTQFLNSSLGSAGNLNRVATTIYSSTDPQITIINKLLGIEIGREYKVIHSGEVDDIQCQKLGAAWNAPENLVTVTKKYTTGSFAGELQRVQHPNGTVELYSYAADATQKTTTVLAGVPDPNNPANILEGTQTVTVTGLGGQVLSRTATYKVPGSPDILTDQDNYAYLDARNRSYIVNHLDGSTEQFNYACCGLDSQIDRDSLTTQYFYDALKRQVASLRNGIITSNFLDPNGALLATIRVGADNSQITSRQQAFDLAGRLTFETNALNGVTSHAYSFDANGQLIHQITYPDTGTRVETYAQDGSLLSVSGTAVHPRNYLYGVDNNGEYTTEVKLDASGGANEWVRTYRDIAGRAWKTVYASSTGSPTSISYFNSVGQLTNTVDSDGVSTLYAYSPKGELAYTVLDSNLNYTIDYSGSDRITFVTNDVTSDNGVNVHRTRTYVWCTSEATSNLLSTVETSVDGLRTWNTIWNSGVPVTSQSRTVYAGGGTRYLTNVFPDGSYSLSTYDYGRLISVTRKDALDNQLSSLSYSYDAHGHQNAVTDVRTGTTTLYFNDADQISGSVTPPPASGRAPQVTTNFFDKLGRVWKTTLPDNTSVTNECYLTGLLKRTYGSRTYPVGYGYDAQGRLNSMTNWTSFAEEAGSRVTSWNYDPYRGWLAHKTYADGKGPTYTYSLAGRLATRKWARGINTIYSYTSLGDLSSVSYDDGATPVVSYGYDRRGRRTAITSGSIVSSLSFDDVGSLLAESYSGGPLDGLVVTNGFDHFLRRTAVALNSEPSTLVNFGYDDASRLQSVTNGPNTVAYTYLANSPLVQNITFKSNGSTRMTTVKSYDNLNRLTQIASTPAADAAVTFSYQYNSANQRLGVTNADNSFWAYKYDDLGQVTAGKKYWSDNTPVAGEQFEYTFDDIGNRQSTSIGGDQLGANLRSASYSANILNQYTSRTVPGLVNILGSANSNATVTLWGSDGSFAATTRKGTYFRGEYAVNNNSAALWLAITNVAALTSGANPDIVTNATGNVFIAKSPELFTYDDDGNLTSDGRWTYTWDAENRLISMVSLANAPVTSKLKLDFCYDYQGRRIQKLVSTNNGSAYVLHTASRFVYDGWNLLATLDAQSSLRQSFVWGLDLSGSQQGAGGVGGLLLVTDVTQGSHFSVFDGNGNITALVGATEGKVSAIYEYGPFGDVIRATGPMERVNQFRSSTQYTDHETDLVCYLHRYYGPSTGRWLSRDQIEETGGVNLYGMIGNDPLNRIDFLGLAETELHHAIPEWLARYSAYGTRNQGLCIRLTTDFHRLTSGFNLEAQLTQIRNQLRAGSINQAQAYNRVLMVHLRNLPAIIRNNRASVGISGGSAVVFRGALQAGLAQAGYMTATEAALGATGIGTVAVGLYYLTDKLLKWGEYDNYNRVGQSEIELYNTQVGIASRAAQLDGSAILSVAKSLMRCPEKANSECTRKFQAALNRNYSFIQTMGVTELGVSIKQARDTVAEGLFIDYLGCLKSAGGFIKLCE